MQASCRHCGAQHSLDDAAAAQPSVRFRCWMCGQRNVFEIPARPTKTQVVVQPRSSPRGGGRSRERTAAGRLPGLALPDGKTITLSVTAGPSKGLELRLAKPLVTIGRAGGGADLEIDDPGVSRMHCAVEVTDGGIRLRDLESTNGTYLNEQRMRSAELEHLSEFRVGSSVVCVRVVSKHR